MIESSNLPIPISFFWYPRILYLYITIYISISYTIFRKGYILKLYNWNWKTGRFWLLCSLTFLYQAFKCPEKFIAHGHRIEHHVEASQSPTIPPIGEVEITKYDTESIGLTKNASSFWEGCFCSLSAREGRITHYELYPLLPPQFFLRFAMRSASPLIRAIASLKKAAEPSD